MKKIKLGDIITKSVPSKEDQMILNTANGIRKATLRSNETLGDASDCNLVEIPGTYRCLNNVLNGPITGLAGGILIMIGVYSDSRSAQLYFVTTGANELYFRTKNYTAGSVWNSWVKIG